MNNPKYMKEYHAKRRPIFRELIDSAKRHPCVECGIQYSDCAMEFDHRVGTEKLFCVGSARSGGYTTEAIKAEISKCDVVCILCHRDRSYQRSRYLLVNISTPKRRYKQKVYKIVEDTKRVPCLKCGKQYNHWQMDLDHIDPDKKIDKLSRLKSFSINTVIEELKKCRVLCALCHRINTIELILNKSA